MYKEQGRGFRSLIRYMLIRAVKEHNNTAAKVKEGKENAGGKDGSPA